jgi:hypothetical protein
MQAVRNLDDLECLACPPKYRSMMTYYKYYSGEKVAPYPTLFSTQPCLVVDLASRARCVRALMCLRVCMVGISAGPWR